ncbi:MAG: hypothetical protein SGILL_003356 [Bacillariaceae sp.]
MAALQRRMMIGIDHMSDEQILAMRKNLSQSAGKAKSNSIHHQHRHRFEDDDIEDSSSDSLTDFNNNSSEDDDECVFEPLAPDEPLVKLNETEIIDMLANELFQRKDCLELPSKAAKKGYRTASSKTSKRNSSGPKRKSRSSSSSDLMAAAQQQPMAVEAQESFQKFLARKSRSMENLVGADVTAMPPAPLTRRERSTSNASSSETSQPKPQDCLKSLLTVKGRRYKTIPVSALSGTGFFVELQEENYSDYTNEVAFAARRGDLEVLKHHVRSGKTALCCNRHKESIIHTMCRKGFSEMLKYSLEEGGASIRIYCDQERTPLHDAAWTHKPNFEIVKTILSECPDLLYLEDNRGHTPLDYVAISQWADWCKFLMKNKDLLVPQSL